jgi:hypothetical protein
MMEVVQLLTDDHVRLRALFAAFERAAGDGERREIAALVGAVLYVHTAVEREILYPAFARAIASAADGEQERGNADETAVGPRPHHATVESSANRLRDVLAAGGPYEPEFVRLRHLVLAHCQEQEEVLFPVARRCLDEHLGWLLAARRAELVAEFGPAAP